MKKRKTVIRHPWNAVSHIVDTCLHAPSTTQQCLPPRPYPALLSGTLGRSSNLPAHLKDLFVILTSPGTHGSLPNSHIFLAGGVYPVWIDQVSWAIPGY